MTRTTRAVGSSLLKQVDKDIASTKQQLGTLETELRELQSLRDSIAGVVLSEATTPRAHDTSRTDALASILANADGPVTVDDMMTELKNQGRPDDKRLVTATVGYLQRKGVATRVDRGTWVAAEQVAA